MDSWIERAYGIQADNVFQVETWLNDLLNTTINDGAAVYKAESINKLSVNTLDLTHIVVVVVVGYYLVEGDEELVNAGAIKVELGTPVRA